MTEQKKIETREEGKYTEFIIPNYELSEREKELDLLDRKCEDWVNTKVGDTKNVDR